MKAIDWAYRFHSVKLNSMQQVSSMYWYIIMTFFLFLAVLFFSSNKGIPGLFCFCILWHCILASRKFKVLKVKLNLGTIKQDHTRRWDMTHRGSSYGEAHQFSQLEAELIKLNHVHTPAGCTVKHTTTVILQVSDGSSCTRPWKIRYVVRSQTSVERLVNLQLHWGLVRRPLALGCLDHWPSIGPTFDFVPCSDLTAIVSIYYISLQLNADQDDQAFARAPAPYTVYAASTRASTFWHVHRTAGAPFLSD